MGLASGGNTAGSFDFELFRESGLIFFFFGAGASLLTQ